MNNTETAQRRYNDTVWNSQRYTHQAPRPELGTLTKLLQGGNPLLWCRANDSIPVSMIQEPTPAEIKQRLKDNRGETHWDESQYVAGSLNRWGLLYFYLTMFAKGAWVILLPFSIISTVILTIIDDTVGLNGAIEFMFYIYIYIPSALIWGYFEASGRGYLPMPWFMKAVKHFTFSRSTGMVTRYKNNKEHYSHPFAEFDCYLISSPSHQGILSYQLHLVHRYQRYSDSIPLHTFSSSQQPAAGRV